jgi:hypothetical protein
MKITHWHIFDNWFLGFCGWSESHGPYHILPALVFVKMEDVNISVRASSITFLWWNKAIQFQLKRWERLVDDKNYRIADDEMESILNEMRARFGWLVDPDAAKIRELVIKNQWLKHIFANGGSKNIYAIGILSSALKQKQTVQKSTLDIGDIL